MRSKTSAIARPPKGPSRMFGAGCTTVASAGQRSSGDAATIPGRPMTCDPSASGRRAGIRRRPNPKGKMNGSERVNRSSSLKHHCARVTPAPCSRAAGKQRDSLRQPARRAQSAGAPKRRMSAPASSRCEHRSMGRLGVDCRRQPEGRDAVDGASQLRSKTVASAGQRSSGDAAIIPGRPMTCDPSASGRRAGIRRRPNPKGKMNGSERVNRSSSLKHHCARVTPAPCSRAAGKQRDSLRQPARRAQSAGALKRQMSALDSSRCVAKPAR